MKKQALLIVFTAVFISACAPNPSTTITSDSISPSPISINNNGSAGYPWGDSKSDFGSNNGGTKIADPIDRGVSILGDVKNNGSIGNPWGNDTNVTSSGSNGTTYTEKSNFGGSNGVTIEETIDSNRWHFGIGLGSGNKYNYVLRDSVNNQNHIDVSTTRVGRNVFIEVKSNLSAKEYVLSYVKDEENLIVKDKQDSPYFILDNLSKGKYKAWLEIGKNLVNLESIVID